LIDLKKIGSTKKRSCVTNSRKKRQLEILIFLTEPLEEEIETKTKKPTLVSYRASQLTEYFKNPTETRILRNYRKHIHLSYKWSNISTIVLNTDQQRLWFGRDI